MKRIISLACAALIGGAMVMADINQAEAQRRGAIVAGIIIGGAVAAITAAELNRHRHVRRYYRYGGHRYRYGRGPIWRQHVAWCYGRYRSYNHHHNHFLAYSGYYRQCRSPYLY